MSIQRITAFLYLVVLGLGTSSCADPVVTTDAVYLDGQFYTANPMRPWASAVAVRGDSFVCVGDDAGAAPFVGPATGQYQLNDALVIPGIIDAHPPGPGCPLGR